MTAQRFWLFLVLIVVIAALVAGEFYFVRKASEALSQNSGVCTADAMLCPDGSYVGRTGPDCEFVCPPTTATSTTDISKWKTYTNANYGISLKYPPDWQMANDTLATTTPHISFGNPLSGKTTYSLNLFIYKNPSGLSAVDYTKQMLANDMAQDASNSAAGPAPQTTPQFTSEYPVTVGNYPGYELYGVFEFDHSGEQVYVQHNKQMILFDFPVAAANPNIASPAANDAIAQEIVNTLGLDPSVGKFCGGIAAFPCPSGYSCQLDGSFPDAGGHCVK